MANIIYNVETSAIHPCRATGIEIHRQSKPTNAVSPYAMENDPRKYGLDPGLVALLHGISFRKEKGFRNRRKWGIDRSLETYKNHTAHGIQGS